MSVPQNLKNKDLNMLEIVPAIIPKDLEDLKIHLAQVNGLVPVVQIDVLDGKFVPNVSWPFYKGDKEEFTKIISQEEGLPFWDSFYFEADLMIEKPEEHVEDFIFAGFSRLIVHIESTNKMGEIIDKCRELDTEIGIAIDIETPNEVLDEYIDRIDFVQFMGIAEIGAQGEPFDARVVEKIAALKAEHPDILVSVDGGVSLETTPFLIGAGAERLVSGSAIFGSEDIAKTLSQFQTIESMAEERFE